ncbi:MAG: single-stranded-DNA-specific exonuclease RecJ, partial [Thiotrichaceae bacterium]|nr:single-stranded-DNA-specific exonuclease RecJ [Thiotrichaceae bacterium]
MIPQIVARTAYLNSEVDADNISAIAQKHSLSALQLKIVAHRISAEQANKAFEKIIAPSLSSIAPPSLLKEADSAVQRISQAISQGEIIALLTDYDVDGITSHAILYHALRDFFSVKKDNIQHLIGHRIDDGYGISQGLVDRILGDQKALPNLIITADCGSSDEEQIARLKEQGIDVIVTDHHAIPEEGIPPSAFATINPTREDCPYPDSTIAGCMVSWLLMSHLRNHLIAHNVLAKDSPKLSTLLDFVSLGTVADAVSLRTPVNRAVVKVGLQVMNQLQRPCWQAIKQLLERDFQVFTAEDLGFQIGPRINARSRMSDPYMALHYLCAPTVQKSMQYLQELDKDNQTRKDTEKDMLAIAFSLAKEQLNNQHWSLVVYHQEFHAGVQGIVASRLMEKFGRPVIVLSPTHDSKKLTGSARTINRVNIREAIEQAAKIEPETVLSFGGHKGAAGLKLDSRKIEAFTIAFDQAVEQQLNAPDIDLRPIIYTDGELAEEELSYETIAELRYLEPFGREFEVPVFEGDFEVQSIKAIGADGTHLMLDLATESHSFRAVWFKA